MVSYAKSIYDRENGRIRIIMTTKDKGNCKRDLYQKTLRLKQFVKHQHIWFDCEDYNIILPVDWSKFVCIRTGSSPIDGKKFIFCVGIFSNNNWEEFPKKF